MANPEREQLKGKGEQVVGGAQETIGSMTGDRDMEAKGMAKKDEGKVREKVGSATEKIEDTAHDVKHAITGD